VKRITLHARAKDGHGSAKAWMIWVTDSQFLAVVLGAIPLFPTSGGSIASPSGPICSAAPLARHWGRIGTPGRIRLDPHPDAGAAINVLARLVRAKRRRGYRDSPA